MEINVTVSVPALEKLLDYAASGLGSVAGPLLAPWRSSREVKAALQATKGDVERQKLLATGNAHALAIIAEAQDTARKRLSSDTTAIRGEMTVEDIVSQRIEYQEAKRQSNITAVTQLAASQLDDDEVQDDEPDHDWTARFFTYIRDVSSEQMQSLWAKVLAGEVRQRGTTAMHTLSVLRNLDQNGATIFRTFCSACVSLTIGKPVPMDSRMLSLGGNAGDNALAKYGFDYGVITTLHEYGLVVSDFNSWRDYQPCVYADTQTTAPRLPFLFQAKLWLLRRIAADESTGPVKLHGVALTQAGRELGTVVTLEPIDEYSRDLVAFLATQGFRMTEIGSQRPPRGVV